MAGNALIGALQVKLGLDTAQFSAGLQKSQTALKGLSDRMQGLSRVFAASLGSFAVGAASAVSFGAAIAGAKAALDEFGNIADAAKAAGVGTDLFQGLTSLAAQSGVAVDQVSDALTTFAKNAGLAAVGKGKLVSVLEKLNPELLRNLQLTTDQEERVRLAADAINAAGSASEKAALSTALFGEAGIKLASAFDGGSAAIDAWMNKARDMGLIVDRDVIAKADEMGDSFDTAAKALDTQLKSAFINIAPLMVDAAKLAADVAKGINDIVDSTRELSARSRQGLETQRADLMNLLANANSSDDMNANPMQVALPAAQVAEMKDQLAKIDAELRQRALDDLRTRLLQLPKDVASTTTSTLAAVDLGPRDLGIPKVTAALKDLGDTGKTAADSIENAFSNVVGAIVRGEDALGSLRNSLADLAESGLDAAIKNIFSGFNFGGLFGGGGFLSTGGGIATLGNVGSFEGGGYTGSGPRTGGLDGRGGFPAVLHPNETVVDHTKGGPDGGKVVNNVYNYGNDRVEQQQNSTGGIDVIIGEVSKHMARGGFDRSLGGRYGVAPRRRRS